MASLAGVWMLAAGSVHAGNEIGWIILVLGWLSIIVAIVAGFWKTFEKAGWPGWGALIPIYNLYLLAKIAGQPGWWVILMFIPIVNLIILILVSLDIAKLFGKTTAFGIGLLMLGVIFYPILGFGSSQYQGPGSVPSAGA